MISSVAQWLHHGSDNSAWFQRGSNSGSMVSTILRGFNMVSTVVQWFQHGFNMVSTVVQWFQHGSNNSAWVQRGSNRVVHTHRIHPKNCVFRLHTYCHKTSKHSTTNAKHLRRVIPNARTTYPIACTLYRSRLLPQAPLVPYVQNQQSLCTNTPTCFTKGPRHHNPNMQPTMMISQHINDVLDRGRST